MVSQKKFSLVDAAIFVKLLSFHLVPGSYFCIGKQDVTLVILSTEKVLRNQSNLRFVNVC